MKGKVLRKTLAAALALLLVSGNIPLKPVTDLFSGAAITASAEGEASNKCGENATWEFDSDTGTLTISGTGAMYDYEYFDQPWFSDKVYITSVVIEDGITSIGSNAFKGFFELTSVSIPESVKSIGADAFNGCKVLTSITIPDGVTSIGDQAFYDCDGLTSIKIPDGVTSIGLQTFVSCEGLTSIEIPGSVTSIGDWAFSECTSLTSIAIPKGVEKIGESVFYGCSNLKTVTLPSSITDIGNNAFNGCTAVDDVYFFMDPEHLTWYGGTDDFKPDKATRCHVPAHLVKEISLSFKSKNVTFVAEDTNKCGANASWEFNSDTGELHISGTGEMYDFVYPNMPWSSIKSEIKSVKIDSGITYIGNHSFDPCTNLKTIDFPETVTGIGEYAFSSTGFETIALPEGITSISEGLFDDCGSLRSVNIPESVTTICKWAFSDCTNLTTITIPKNVTYIGEAAFYECKGLKSFYSFADPKNLTWGVNLRDFKENKATVCYVPSEYYSTYAQKFSDVNISFRGAVIGKCGDNAYWCFDSDTHKLTISGTGAMYNYYDDPQPWNDYSDNITSVVIENGITSIGSSAFDSCAKLTSVSIPDSVKSIGADAFYGCTSLESITIPDGVTSIGNYAFSDCTSLTSLTIPDSVTSIGEFAFVSCEGLKSVEIGSGVTSIGECVFAHCEGLESVEIGSNVESIGVNAFFDCTSLTSVTIPDSVKSIGGYAFNGCTSLESITIPDSVTSIGKEAFLNCTNIKDVYCYAAPNTLTWIDGDCDDFIKTPKHTTVCHVSAEHIGDYTSEKFSGVNVTFKAEAMGECGDHAYWCFDSDTHKLTISGTGAMNDCEYAPHPWYKYSDNITSVEIGNGVTSIGNHAFDSYANLTSVSIPESVKSIGADAFAYCTGLTSITIPDGVKSIGGYAFDGCTSLKSVTIPGSVTSIGSDAFFDCTNITDVYCYADPENLTWNVDYHDFKDDGSTVCHVPAEYLDKYNSSKFSDVNVTFVGDLVDMGLGEHLYGHSITLDGSIGVNFYVELTDELLASDTAAMVFTVPSGSKSETQTLLVKDVIAQGSNKVVIGGKTYYKFKCSVSAKDMASDITAQLVDGDKAGTEYKYSVKDYADYLLTHTDVEEYANAAQLVKKMLSYGAYSQQLFGEGTPLSDSYKGDVSGVDIPATFKYNAVKTILPDGVTLEGATLSLKSETTLSLYFKGLPQNTKFTCAGKTVETAKNGEYVIARIRGIKADELESSFTVAFTGGSVEYSPMTYCYNVLSGGSTDEKLQNVCKALYQYAQAAKVYFGEGVKDENEPDF